MTSINRRNFIKNSSLAAAGMVFANSAMAKKKYIPHLSFSTLGCPKWTFMQIVNAAVEYGYDGIEIRGILNYMDITKCPEFSSTESIARTMKILKDKNMELICLGASTNLHYADAAKRKSNLDEAKSLIDLAQKVNSPYIRVFPDKLPEDQDRKATLELIMSGLLELGDHAKGSKVSVLMETHGDVVKTDDLLGIMQQTAGPHVGLIWDISNMWCVTKEPPSLVYGELKKYIKHIHFRDAKMVNGKEQSALLGQGEVPLKEAAKLLEADNYKGFFSFEWEKRWMPRVEDPEIAFPQFVKEIKTYF
jgi:sugar phosphate isomerase/epimerase